MSFPEIDSEFLRILFICQILRFGLVLQTHKIGWMNLPSIGLAHARNLTTPLVAAEGKGKNKRE